MDEQATCRLYALALSLVPEPNIAGDIFLFARSEADLRRRAAAWRRRQGLPDPAGDPPLPPLDADQRELALLLARRGRRQRRLRPWLAVATGGTLALVLLATLLRPAVPVPVLAAEPAFTATPIQTAVPGTGLRLQVYHAEATPGALTVWWALSGRRAVQAAGRHSLALADPAGSDWLSPAEGETAAQGDDRLVGRSTFAVANPDWSLATVSLQAGQGRRWELQVPVTLAGSDPAARRFSVGRIYRYGEYVISVDAVDVTANYTALHYAVTAPGSLPAPPAPVMLIEDWGNVYFRGFWPGAPAGTRTAVFEPLRAGAKRLQVAFPMPAPEPVIVASVPLTGSRRQDSTVTATATLPPGISPAALILLSDGAGRRHVITRWSGRVTPDGLYMEVSVDGFPPDARPERLVLTEQPPPLPRFTLDLPPAPGDGLQGPAPGAPNP